MRTIARDRSEPTEVARISSPTWSEARKRPYLRKDITVTHTQAGILVGKCGQNVGTTLPRRDGLNMTAAGFQVGDRVFNGFGRYRIEGTIDEVIDKHYVMVQWDDGVEGDVFFASIRRVSDEGSN
jgi:hypothetical protein